MTLQHRQKGSKSSPGKPPYKFQIDIESGKGECDCPGYRQRVKEIDGVKVRDCTHLKEWRVELGLPETTQECAANALVPVRSQAQADKAAAVAVRGYDAAPANISPMLASAMPGDWRNWKASIGPYANNPAFILEEKFNGHRWMVKKLGASITGWSRSGKSIDHEIHPAMRAEIALLPDGVYDGESYVPGGVHSDVRALKNSGLTHYKMFDVYSLMGEVVKSKTQRERRSYLEIAYAHVTVSGGGAHVSIATQEPVTVEAVERILASGGEGAIVKRLTSTYQPGVRSDDWVKIKKSGVVVTTITGWKKGESGPHSTVIARDEFGVEVKAKTLNDAMRAAISVAPESFIGRKLVIAYQEKTATGKYQHSMWDHLL